MNLLFCRGCTYTLSIALNNENPQAVNIYFQQRKICLNTSKSRKLFVLQFFCNFKFPSFLEGILYECQVFLVSYENHLQFLNKSAVSGTLTKSHQVISFWWIFYVNDEILDTRITIYYSTREGRRRLRPPPDLYGL